MPSDRHELATGRFVDVGRLPSSVTGSVVYGDDGCLVVRDGDQESSILWPLGFELAEDGTSVIGSSGSIPVPRSLTSSLGFSVATADLLAGAEDDRKSVNDPGRCIGAHESVLVLTAVEGLDAPE